MVVEWAAALSPPPRTHPWNHFPGEMPKFLQRTGVPRPGNWPVAGTTGTCGMLRLLAAYEVVRAA